jgi:hypothetical protein
MVTIGNIVTFMLAAAAGYALSAKVAAPRRWAGWMGWIAVLFVAGFIGVDTAIISIFGFAIYVNVLLQGLVFGLLASMAIRRRGVAV